MYSEIICEIINEKISTCEISLNQTEDDLCLLGMDSIAFIHIIVALEEQMDIEIPDEYLIINEMNTIQKILNVVSLLKE